jgi:hypothetical protein
MERLLIAEGVLGPAWIVVPISESELDRWMFNDAVALIFGRDVRTTSELALVADFTSKMTGQIREEDMLDPTDRESIWTFHKTLILRMMEQSDMSPAARDAR